MKFANNEPFEYRIYNQYGDVLFTIDTTSNNKIVSKPAIGKNYLEVEDALVDLFVVEKACAGVFNELPLKIVGITKFRSVDTHKDHNVRMTIGEAYMKVCQFSKVEDNVASTYFIFMFENYGMDGQNCKFEVI